MFYSLISLCAHTLIDITLTLTPTPTHTHVHAYAYNQTTKQQTKQRVWKKSKNNKLDKCFFNIQHRNICNVFPNRFFFVFYFNPLPLSLCLYIFEKLNQMLYFCALNIHNIRFICLFVCFTPKTFEPIIQTKPHPARPVPAHKSIPLFNSFFEHTSNCLMFLYVWLSISVSLSFSHSLSLSLSNCITV